MSISVLLFVVGISGANLSRFLPKKKNRDSTTELISLLCFNFYIELTSYYVRIVLVGGVPSMQHYSVAA